MTDPTGTAAGPAADQAGGDGWAKTVVDGVPTEESASADSSAGGDTIDTEVVDAEVIDGEVVDAEEPAEDSVGDEHAVQDSTVQDRTARDISVEDLVADLERVTAERDQYLDASRRIQAEFENYKKQVAKREADARERANDSLIGDLLPVLDAFDGAVASGVDDVLPMRSTFLDALAKQGLERIDGADGPFDPNHHEAVMHEEDADTDGPVVAEVMRAGYAWKGRVLRPAMVKTRG